MFLCVCVCVFVFHGLRCFLGGARCVYRTFVLFVTVDSFLGGGVAFFGEGPGFRWLCRYFEGGAMNLWTCVICFTADAVF